MNFSDCFSSLEVFQLQEIPGISSLAWTPQGLLLLADNVAGIYLWDPVLKQVKPFGALNPEQGFAPIGKAEKPDYEASLYAQGSLWLFGSGSLKVQREKLLKIELESRKTETYSLSNLYQQIADRGLEMNIEGATLLGDTWILANRGHLGVPHNHLILSQNQAVQQIQTLDLKQKPFAGLSGLEYEAEQDRLWFIASTETTSSSYEDGTIGDAYLGWIDHYSKQLEKTEIVPSQLLNLSQYDSRLAKQKIEGLALSSENLFLGSDNDGEQPGLFVFKRCS